MSQTINSNAAGIGLAGPESSGPASAGAAATSPTLDLISLLGDLSDAISVVTVIYRSLVALQISAVEDEETALRYALTLLRSAYRALDIASCRSS